MRITKLQCRGLYSYREQVSADISDRVVIVGPNNSGKSNLFRLIGLLADALSRPPALKDSQIYRGVLDPSLGLHVKLSRGEAEKIVDFFSFFVPDGQGMRFHEYENRDLLAGLLDEIAVGVSWEKTAKYGIQTSVEIEFLKMGLVASGDIAGNLRMSDHVVSEQEEAKVNLTKPLRDLLIELSDQASAKSATAGFFREYLLEMPHLKEDHHKISEHGKRTLASLQSYVGTRGDTSREVRFTELVGEILARSTVHSPDSRDIDGWLVQDRIESLKLTPGQDGVLGSEEAAAYNVALVRVARFRRSVPSEALAADGSNLSSFLLGLKTSPVPADRERFESIRRAFGSVFGPEKLRLDVILERPEHEGNSGRPRLRPTFAAPAAVITDGSGQQFPAADAGAGLRESIYLLALVLGSRDSVVLLDEPSINMHPGLTRAILGEICGNEGNQILITTHSPAIVGFMAFENSSKVLYVRNAGSSSTVRALEGEAFERFDKDRSRLRHLIDPAIFFAKCVVLVEGPSDQSLLAGVAEYKAGEDQKYDLARGNVSILRIDGDGNFGKYIDLLEAYEIPYVVLADRDDGNKKRRKWLENRETAEFPSDCGSGIGADIVLVEKNLEHMMKSIDGPAFEAAEKAGGDSKIAVAIEFCRIMREQDTQKLCRITAFLDYCVGRGLEEGGAGQDGSVSQGG